MGMGIGDSRLPGLEEVLLIVLGGDVLQRLKLKLLPFLPVHPVYMSQQGTVDSRLPLDQFLVENFDHFVHFRGGRSAGCGKVVWS